VRAGASLTPGEAGWAVCPVVCQPATHDYQNTTGCGWMLVLIHQRY
jgi:hypothetical protein